MKWNLTKTHSIEFPLLVGMTNQISITNYSNIVNETSTILPKNPLDVDFPSLRRGCILVDGYIQRFDICLIPTDMNWLVTSITLPLLRNSTPPDTEIDGIDNSEIAAIIIRASVLPLNVSIPNLEYTSGFVIEGKIERQAIFLNISWFSSSWLVSFSLSLPSLIVIKNTSWAILQIYR